MFLCVWMCVYVNQKPFFFTGSLIGTGCMPIRLVRDPQGSSTVVHYGYTHHTRLFTWLLGVDSGPHGYTVSNLLIEPPPVPTGAGKTLTRGTCKHKTPLNLLSPIYFSSPLSHSWKPVLLYFSLFQSVFSFPGQSSLLNICIFQPTALSCFPLGLLLLDVLISNLC